MFGTGIRISRSILGTGRIMKTILIFLFILFTSDLCCSHDENEGTISKVNAEKFSLARERRYLLYDVNHGEGFNLRRDVYMRIANLVRVLRENGHNFILVLPPWGGLYHWQTRKLGQQIKIPWSLFFDLESLNHFVPVIEFEQYLEEIGKNEIELVYYLQHYSEGWQKWEEKWDYRPCIENKYYSKNWDGTWNGWFFGFDEVYAKEFHCISIQGHASHLMPLILTENNTAVSIMFDRAETILHDTFGDIFYWKARRSMRFNKELVEIGDNFRKNELQSNDVSDGTVRLDDWTKMKVKEGSAKGGPYICVHWRRKDFVRAHGSELPSVKGTAEQLNKHLEALKLSVIFVATDAPDSEVDELRSFLPSNVLLKRFVPTEEMLQKYKDGGVAIIDQWICSHARYFTGSHVSTFSFRIQDEREILGFNHGTTFNRLCPDDNLNCEQPSKWPLVQ